MTRHTVAAFDDELSALSVRISEMGRLAAEQLDRALEAVATRDAGLAGRVVSADRDIDAMEIAVEEMAIETLALRQPMANDLREVVAALKIASTLERIGDLAKNIAKRARAINREHPLAVSAAVVQMGRKVRTLLAEVLDAYARRDTALAVSVWMRDVEIDDAYNAIFRDLMSRHATEPGEIGLATQLHFIAKNLERIGDHATFIAEMVHFVVEGRPLTDDRPKNDPLDELPASGG